jgi:peptidyl-prolyl cis-trans isomerase D
VVFDPQNYEGKILISPQEVAAIYQSSPEKFSDPKKVKARHILIKIPSAENPEALQQARKRAEEIYALAKKGEDFASLAMKYSEDTGTAKNGGDLGYFQSGQMAQQFEQAAFSLGKGEISAVIQTPYGFHVIKVEDVVEARVKPLEEVKEEIVKELRQEQAEDIAEKEAEQAYNKLFRSKDLDSYAREKGVPIKETPLLSSKELRAQAVVKKELVDTAFSLKKDTLSTVIKVPPHYYLLKVIERQEQHIPSLTEVRGEVEKALRTEKERLLAQDRANRILAQLNGGEAIETIASKEKIALLNTGFFNRRGDSVPKIGRTGELKEIAFSLTPDHPYPGKPLFIGENFCLIKLKEKKDVGKDQFKAEEEAFRQTMLKKKQRETFDIWLENTRKGYKIDIAEKAL